MQGRYGFKRQFNVRNLFSHNELVPSVINPDGTVPVWSISEGRRVTATMKLTF